MFQAFLIKYAEIAIKGKNRSIFEDALLKQIRRALKDIDGSFNVFKTRGRVHVEADGPFDYDGALEIWSLKAVKLEEGFEIPSHGVIVLSKDID